MKNKKPKLNMRARLLHQATGTWLFGGPSPKFTGTSQQIETALRVACATKAFKESLDIKQPSVKFVMEALQEKHRAAAAFEKEFGVKWLL